MPRSVEEIIRQGEVLARRFETFKPAPAGRAPARSLALVHRAALGRAKAEAHVLKAVTKARADGNSWNAIGSMLGTSGEAARQRYGVPRVGAGGSSESLPTYGESIDTSVTSDPP